MIKIAITLDNKEQLDLLITSIDHLHTDDLGMSQALKKDGKIGDATKLSRRAEALKALRAVISGNAP